MCFIIRELWRFFRQARATKQKTAYSLTAREDSSPVSSKPAQHKKSFAIRCKSQEQSVLPLCRTSQRSFKKKSTISCKSPVKARAFFFVKLMDPIKYDNSKTLWHLIPFDALEPVAKVLEFGAQKYSPWNWAQNKGFFWTRVFSATLRHLFAWVRGEDLDPETNLSHLAHAVCNLLFLIHYTQNREKYTLDDRMKHEPL